MTLLEFRGVSKRFRRGSEIVKALDHVDLTVDEGEVVAIMGPSGSGKSTLLHLAGGLDTPDDGTIRFGGREFGHLSVNGRARLRRREIGFVFQFFHLIPTLTVAENVALPMTLDRKRADGRVRELIEWIGLTHRAKHLPGELSGGEMQRAAIARALVAEPRMLLADEPTGNLDSANGRAVLDLLVGATEEVGSALVVVTHDPELAGRARRVLRMSDGRLIGRDDGQAQVEAEAERATLQANPVRAD